ncbi:PstS family phosphate ABC transporter substrate-binding protein [Thermocrispum sp.]|nr:PstS family phosphate ABC transporter substrate-binding protein [Thermocrispum sp.]
MSTEESGVMRYGWVTAAAAVAVASLAVTACGPAGQGGGLSIKVDGSSTVGPLTQAAAELFSDRNPDLRVGVATSGTGGGFEKFCNGEIDIADASRKITAEEAEMCRAGGVSYYELQVANDAITVLVHRENPVNCLTVDQLRQIWAPGSQVNNWNQIDGIDYDAELTLYGPGTDSGTFEFFAEEINGDKEEQRADYQDIGEDDNTGIAGVMEDEGAMFYVGFEYYDANKDRVKALQIDAGDGCVAPTPEAVQSGEYQPLSRPLYIYPSRESMQKKHVKAFVDYFVDNSAEIARLAGYIPMTDEQAAKTEQALSDR